MNGEVAIEKSGLVQRKIAFRVGDFAWLLFIAVLILTIPETNYNATILLVLIGIFQIIEPRLRLFASPRGQVASITLKLLLSYYLIGYSHTIFSPYYPIFLLPVVSAATIFELRGVVLVIATCCCAYFSYLLPVFPIDWSTLPPDQLSLMSTRASFIAIVGFLVYEQAHAKRQEMQRTQDAAERLAESNRNLRRAEASLRRTERLAALGQLTAGLAHELRNPLGTIRASAEMMTKEQVQNRPEVMSEMAGYIGSEADRINSLVSSFLDFARPLQVRPVTADIRPLIDEVVRQQSELARGKKVHVATDIRADDTQFQFDPDLLALALSNLVQNAIQASAQNGEVCIRVDESDETMLLFVTDHGSGIAKENLENIFNPFFTTKPRGVGLGLAIVSKIVDEHQGRINVFSEQNAGTRFEMVLPKVQPD